MPWYIQFSLAFLIGYSISNAWLRHHALTLIIWISKASMWILTGVVTACEWTQDKFDDIEYVPQVKVKPQVAQKVATQKIKTESEPNINFETASTEEIYKYINDHPEKIRVRTKGGE